MTVLHYRPVLETCYETIPVAGSGGKSETKAVIHNRLVPCTTQWQFEECHIYDARGKQLRGEAGWQRLRPGTEIRVTQEVRLAEVTDAKAMAIAGTPSGGTLHVELVAPKP